MGSNHQLDIQKFFGPFLLSRVPFFLEINPENEGSAGYPLVNDHMAIAGKSTIFLLGIHLPSGPIFQPAMLVYLSVLGSMTMKSNHRPNLGGGFKHFLFLSPPGEMIQFD